MTFLQIYFNNSSPLKSSTTSNLPVIPNETLSHIIHLVLVSDFTMLGIYYQSCVGNIQGLCTCCYDQTVAAITCVGICSRGIEIASLLWNYREWETVRATNLSVTTDIKGSTPWSSSQWLCLTGLWQTCMDLWGGRRDEDTTVRSSGRAVNQNDTTKATVKQTLKLVHTNGPNTISQRE